MQVAAGLLLTSTGRRKSGTGFSRAGILPAVVGQAGRLPH
jgi:hypothetical protein